jgi:hypothetical protein
VMSADNIALWMLSRFRTSMRWAVRREEMFEQRRLYKLLHVSERGC